MSTAMPMPSMQLTFDHPLVVGSVSNRNALIHLNPSATHSSCDILEIRLDGLISENSSPEHSWWHAFREFPLLFTARRQEEGGLGALDVRSRMALLESVLPDAAAIDIEAASIRDMQPVVEQAAAAAIPWIASFHDFAGMPAEDDLIANLQRAKDAGAAVFKWAATPHSPSDLLRIAEFQLRDHGIPVASMGMGPLAVVSRLLCAQCGSVLNYGYLGDQPTAPGQWDAGTLRHAISRLPRL